MIKVLRQWAAYPIAASSLILEACGVINHREYWIMTAGIALGVLAVCVHLFMTVTVPAALGEDE